MTGSEREMSRSKKVTTSCIPHRLLSLPITKVTIPGRKTTALASESRRRRRRVGRADSLEYLVCHLNFYRLCRTRFAFNWQTISNCKSSAFM